MYKQQKPWIGRGFVDEASPAAVHPATDIHVDEVAEVK